MLTQKIIITTPECQPEDFRLLAQNMRTYEICGYSNAEGYKEVDDIPAGFEQRVLPSQYGRYLTLSQITTGLMLENGELLESIDHRTDMDYRVCRLELGLYE